VTCDGRLFHRRGAATGNALSTTVDRRVRRTSRDVDEAEERSRRLASVSAGQRSSSHRYVEVFFRSCNNPLPFFVGLTPKHICHNQDPKRHLMGLKHAL